MPQIDLTSSDRKRARLRFPNILDRYVFRKYLTIFFLVLISLLAIVVIVTFLENINTINRYTRQWSFFFSFLWFKIPDYMNQIFPLTALISTLLTLGLLNKSNEITAMKVIGVSLYRIILPLCLPALILCSLSFYLQENVIPLSNTKAEKIWNEMKSNRSIGETGDPWEHWIINPTGKRIYHYFTSQEDAEVFSQLHIFNIDPVKWALRSRIYAERGYLKEQRLYLTDAWQREFDRNKSIHFIKSSEIVIDIMGDKNLFVENQNDFNKMNYNSLSLVINNFKKRGFDTQKLRVDLNYKLSSPFLSIIMTLIGIPFAFLMGKRGALGGIGLSLVIAIIYWGCTGIFKNLGYTYSLNAYWAAWGPHFLFGLAGLYLIAKMRT